MRILLSSIGRRGYLARYFKEAVGPGGEVWGGDCMPYTSAFHDCDNSVLLPKVTDPDYINELLALCKRSDIDILVPLIDPELNVLSRTRQRFFDAGIMAVVSPPRTIDISFDKYLTYQFGRDHGILVPKTAISLNEAQQLLDSGELTWPVVVKPRKGSASTDISLCHNMQQLEAAYGSCSLPMIQEYLDGEEYGYDLFGDQKGRLISIFCKRKLAMRAGETDKAISIREQELLALGRKVGEALEIFGPLDADVIATPTGPKLLELNPRFGGGYPCAHLCGADFPGKLMAMRRGEDLMPDADAEYPVGVHMFKQDEIISGSQATIESIRPCREVAASRPLNLLFCSAGRRVSLLQEFRRAANDLGSHIILHAADHNTLAPTFQMVDKTLIAPSIDSEQYIDRLLDYCEDQHMDALIPLIDPELPLLSAAREHFAKIGTRVIISSPQVIRISMDKVLTAKFLLKNGFRTPRIFTEEELIDPSYPLFIKPLDGSSSLGAYKVPGKDALEYLRRISPGSIVQEFIDGIEFTVDVFADFDGRPLCAVPRRRHEVRGGEVSKGQSVKNARIIEENRRLVEVLGGCIGMVTIQCFLTPEDEVVFIEINPRFGGGVPLSIRAGADSPKWLLELLLGRTPAIESDCWTDGLLMLRYDQGIFTMPSELPHV